VLGDAEDHLIGHRHVTRLLDSSPACSTARRPRNSPATARGVPAEEIDVVDSRREQLTLPLPWRYVSAAEPAKVPTTFTVVLP
jgi:hypothetical protein